MPGLIATQLVGTATLRPYVIGFLVLFLIAATRDLGTRRTVCYLGWALGVALAAGLAPKPGRLAPSPRGFPCAIVAGPWVSHWPPSWPRRASASRSACTTTPATRAASS